MAIKIAEVYTCMCVSAPVCVKVEDIQELFNNLSFGLNLKILFLFKPMSICICI